MVNEMSPAELLRLAKVRGMTTVQLVEQALTNPRDAEVYLRTRSKAEDGQYPRFGLVGSASNPEEQGKTDVVEKY